MKKFVLSLLLISGLAQASPFSEAFEPLKIVDRAPEKADFAQFRSKLLKVVQERDSVALKNYLGERIQYSFGLARPGIAGFYGVWKPANRDSELWKHLEVVLKNGGSFDNRGLFTAPSWYANWPADRDEMEWGVVAEPSVTVYSQPRSDSQTLPEIGPCWVHLNQNSVNQENRNFTCIDLPKAMQNPYKVESAFVPSEKVHRLLDYRAVFAKRQGRWQMISFLAGD